MLLLKRLLCRTDSTSRCNTLTIAWAQGILQLKQRPGAYYSESHKAVMWNRC